MSTLALAGKIADGLSVCAWTAIAIYFVRRFAQHRKLVSLMIALMALGWASACLDAAALGFDLSPWRGMVALALAISVGYAIVRVERTGR